MSDKLKTCSVCADCYTDHESGICHFCREQDDIDDDDDESGWTMDEEEALIADGICPECGGELEVCGHGADWFDDDEDEDE